MKRISALLLALALVGSACTSESADTTTSTSTVGGAVPQTTTTLGDAVQETTTTTEPKPFLKPYGGEIGLYAAGFLLGEANTLNPLLDVDRVSLHRYLLPAHTTGVWRRNGDSFDPEPAVVVDLPSKANGGLVENEDGSVTIHLEIRPDAVWADGEPITGNDFAFTYELYAEELAAREDLDYPGADFRTLTGDTLQIGLRSLESYKEIVPGSLRVDDKHVSFTLSDLSAWRTGELFEVLVPEHAVRGTDFFNDWNNRMWPSAGPFAIASWDTAAGEVVLKRNPNYWGTDPETGQQLPYLDRIVLGLFPEETLAVIDEFWRPLAEVDLRASPPGTADLQAEAAALGYSDEDIDRIGSDYLNALLVAQTGLLEEGVIAAAGDFIIRPWHLAAAQDPEIEFKTTRSQLWEHIAFQYGDPRLVANPESLVEHLEFRQAIAHAIDRQELARRVYGVHVDPMKSLVETYSPSLAGEGWGRYDFDPAAGRALLEALCDRLDRDCEADPPKLKFTGDISFREDHRAVGEALMEMLSGIGIEVTLESEFLGNYIQCGTWEAATWGWAFSGLLPVIEIFDAFDPSNPGENPYYWGVEEVVFEKDVPDTPCDETVDSVSGRSSAHDEFTERFDTLLRRADATVEADELTPIIREMEEILASQAVFIPLYVRPNFNLYRSDIIEGYGFDYWQFDYPIELWNAGEWYRADLAS